MSDNTGNIIDDIIIKKMQERDLDAVAAIEQEIFSMPWSRQGFADVLYREDVLFLIAEKKNQVLGYVGIYLTEDEGEITNVAVTSQARRQGIARQLLQELIRQLEDQNIYRIVLEVRVSNEPAIRLYEEFGFENAGKRKNFYEKPTEDAYVMVRQPEFSYGK